MKKFVVVCLALLLCQQVAFAQKDSLDTMIGQMIMVGLGDFNQLDKNAPVFTSIRNGKTGGVILFEKNLSLKNTNKRLQNILSYAQEQADIPLFVSIDEEGGLVNRLKPKYGFPKTVRAQYLGDLDNLDSTKLYAIRTASSLHLLGINMNFAPSVDVNINPENPVIGGIGRSFSEDPMKVTSHAEAVIDAHELFGVATVLKHFPGHGSSMHDSHLGMTDVSNTWRFEELYPYKALIDSGKVRAIMTAHIINTTLDPEKIPSTLSKPVISGILRGFLGYDGVIVSDDMQMRAISSEYGLEEAVKKSILAGVDILLFANNVPGYDLSAAEKIHGIIKDYVQSGEISPERIRESYIRIMKLKKSLNL